MKKRIAVLALTGLLSLSESRADLNQNFACINNMFRHSRFEVAYGRLTLQDSHVRDIGVLEDIFEKNLSLSKDQLGIHEVGFSASSHDGAMNCTSSGDFLLNCTVESRRAYIQVQGSLRGENGVSGNVWLSKEVDVKKFVFESELVTHPLREERLMIEAKAAVVIDGQELTLEWGTFFYPGPKSDQGSWCAKK